MAREKKQECPEGAPAWIVTFSDLMSLLLTFFVLLLSFSSISEKDFNQAMMSLQGAFGVLKAYPAIVGMAMRKEKPSKEAQEAAIKLRRMMQVAEDEHMLQKVKISYDALGGLKISLPGSLLFGPGDTVVQPEAARVLDGIAEILAEMPDTFIEVSGHTDDTPMTSTALYRDNVELSYFRADAVRRRLIDSGGIPADQFEVHACGESQPVASNASEEGRQANRRVELYVRGLVDKDKAESLKEGVSQLEGFEPRKELPLTPGELDALRR